MYSTCLHCHRPLGRNDAIEHFPVGRRLAFDAAKGRLWVVCAACSRWNLTPIEERWEAVEESEKLFRGERLRAQTDNIGLVRVADGTELVRIGRALRPEFAAWRYGRMFRRRFRRSVALRVGAGVASAVGAGALVLAGLPEIALFVAAPLILVPTVRITTFAIGLRGNLTTGAPKVMGADGKPLVVIRKNLDHIKVTAHPGESLRLWLSHAFGHQELTGDRAARALSTVLAHVNSAGGWSRAVSDASALIADAGDPAAAIVLVAAEAQRCAGDFEERAAEFARGPRGKTLLEVLAAQRAMRQRSGRMLNGLPPSNPGALHRLPPAYRLALEMALHEHSEQHALDEELSALERAWREAEEIAAIADSLLVSDRTTRFIDAARQ